MDSMTHVIFPIITITNEQISFSNLSPAAALESWASHSRELFEDPKRCSPRGEPVPLGLPRLGDRCPDLDFCTFFF